jgi:hypothetical protein
MFRSPYEFRYVNAGTLLPGGPVLKEHRFEFLGKGDVAYWVTLEEFPYQLFGVKFCLKNDRKSKKRFQVLTGYNDTSRIVATCFAIMLSILSKFGSASFGFVGMNSDGESLVNSKRFRVYKKAMQNTFSPILFEHKEYLQQSGYLILNRKMLKQYPNAFGEIESIFQKYFALPEK